MHVDERLFSSCISDCLKCLIFHSSDHRMFHFPESILNEFVVCIQLTASTIMSHVWSYCQKKGTSGMTTVIPRAQYYRLILVFCPVVNPAWESLLYLFVLTIAGFSSSFHLFDISCQNGSVSSLRPLCWSVSFAFKYQDCTTKSQSWDSPVFFVPDSSDWLYVVLPYIMSFYYQSLSRRRWMKKMRCWVRLKWNRPHRLSQSQPLWSPQLRENVDVLQRTSRRVSVQSAPVLLFVKDSLPSGRNWFFDAFFFFFQLLLLSAWRMRPPERWMTSLWRRRLVLTKMTRRSAAKRL